MKYISGTDQAKLIRKALKEAFGKTVKFSVRQSSGSAINISWNNGPTQKQVDQIVSTFNGGYFDGMEDYHGGYNHSMNGEEIRFAIDFIFTSRTLTEEFIDQCKTETKQLTAQDRCDIWNKSSSYWLKDQIAGLERNSDEYNHGIAQLYAHQKGIEANQSPTAESLHVIDKY